jgi:sialate O-acetylesterase
MLRMIAPVSLTAVLYYQGEEDTWRTDRYDDLMIALIRHWRKLFRDAEMPFLFVQLPMWIDFGAEDTFRWPATRLAQAAARDAVRNTGMVCLLDQGEYGNIHPVDKVPVGLRLAELAGKKLYGEGEESPRATGMTADGDTVTVRLDRAVVTRDGKAPALMEAAGEDGVFVPAEAEIDGTVLRLRAASVVRPVQARYAWTDYSDKVNLFGENGLPLEPFWIGKDPSTSPCFAQNDTPSMN